MFSVMKAMLGLERFSVLEEANYKFRVQDIKIGCCQCCMDSELIYTRQNQTFVVSPSP
jgi:hypothetical protein